jgi:SAM-dependent methyltransferase
MASASADTNAAPVAEVLRGFWRPRVLCAAAQLGIPEAMGDGPTASEEIARRTGSDPRAVFRLLRALTVIGACAHRGGSMFELTAAGRLLRLDAPGSMYGYAAHVGDRVWGMFGDLDEVVRRGGRAVGDDAGFKELSSDPAGMAAFHSSMALQSLTEAKALLEAFDFSQYRTVADVGGGYGGFLRGLLEAIPELTGQVFDLPVLARDAQRYLADAGLSDRAEFVGGDFFAEVPAGADAYVLKYIVHDWDDDQAVRILQSCRKAAGASGEVLLIERVAPELVNGDAEHGEVIGSDVIMMSYGGMERTTKEYAALMAQADLTLFRVAPAAGGCCVLHGVAARTGPEEAAERELETERGDRETAS